MTTPPINQPHTNPATAPLFNFKRRGRRVGELKRSAKMKRIRVNVLALALLCLAVVGCACRSANTASNSDEYDEMRVRAFEMGRAFEMEHQASLVIDYERPDGILLRIPGQTELITTSDEDLAGAVRRATPKRDYAVVIIGKPVRYEFPEPHLKVKVDQIEAVLKSQGFARIVFQLMSATGRPIYRE